MFSHELILLRGSNCYSRGRVQFVNLLLYKGVHEWWWDSYQPVFCGDLEYLVLVIVQVESGPTVPSEYAHKQIGASNWQKLWQFVIFFRGDLCRWWRGIYKLSYWNLEYYICQVESGITIPSLDPCVGRLGIKLNKKLWPFFLCLVIKLFYRGVQLLLETGVVKCVNRLQGFSLIDSS